MRKMMFVFFALLAISMMAMPAYAQGGSAAASGGANWVAIASGFGIAIAAGSGRTWPGPCRCCSLRSHGSQPCRASSDSAGLDSWPGFHRVAGAVYAGYHFRQGCLVLPWSTCSAPSTDGAFCF